MSLARIPTLPHLDDPLSRVDRRHKLFMHALKSSKQFRVSAVAEANPDQSSSVARPISEEDEIFVIADHDPILA
jgi:hypothetical protein